MKKKMMKAIKELNAYIDNDREKLCDRLHDLELSYKRMERLLIRTQYVLKICSYYVEPGEDFRSLSDLYCSIGRELSYPYFRVNYKMKGGKNA